MHLFNPPTKKNDSSILLGSVRLSERTYFVYKNSEGQIFVNNNFEEKSYKKNLEINIQKVPSICRILKKYGLTGKINTKILSELVSGHMNDTCKIALGIYSILSETLSIDISKKTLQQAAELHDVGKVFIPKKIICKAGKLNKKEKKIMNIHSRLGYELLKSQNINYEILELVKYHHQNLKRTGYPILVGHTPSDIAIQIISIADKYSALREARVYRRGLSKQKALLILYEEVLSGKILKEVFNALMIYVKNND